MNIIKQQWNSINHWMIKIIQECEKLKQNDLYDLKRKGRKLVDDGYVEYEQIANVLECISNMESTLYASLEFFQEQAEILHYHMREDYDYETLKAETEEETRNRHEYLFDPYI